jgi:N-acetylmuramoyl-L-alanine amidase
MFYRRLGSCLVLSALALLPAFVASAQDEPVRAAAPIPLDDTPFDSALDCLALNIYWEARAEPRLGQIAVAEVTLNRVADPAFPHTVCGVVRQGEERGLNLCQFSWHCDGIDDRPRDPSAWQRARRLAILALSGRLSDPTGGARWFHSDQVDPDWPELTPIVKIGSHVFYRMAPVDGQARTEREDSPPLPPVRKPASPTQVAAAETDPSPASGPGPNADPVPASACSDGSDHNRTRVLEGSSAADALAPVDRTGPGRTERPAACGHHDPADTGASPLALEAGFLSYEPADRSAGSQPAHRGRTLLADPGGQPELIGSAGGPARMPPARDRPSARPF